MREALPDHRGIVPRGDQVQAATTMDTLEDINGEGAPGA